MALDTPQQIDNFRFVLITKAIGMYLKHNMQVNRAYTPAAMRAMATEFTGIAYPRSRKGLEAAHADLLSMRPE
jgi:hypothetical protein